MKDTDYCVIMAGGIGSRFWPISTTEKPKQFLDILGIGKSLLQLTYQRFCKIIPANNIIVVTSENYRHLVSEQLPDLPEDNILTEPIRRNTAPCISYANFKILSRTNNANIVVTPADHLIIDESAFSKNIQDCLSYVRNNNTLLTIGIKPHRPDTGYGYIQIEQKGNENSKFKKVKTFTEKPDKDLAKFFLESGEFHWNSGIFIWSLNSIQQAMETHLPEVYNLFKEIADKFGTKSEFDFINKIYSECKSISIDYGVMEKAKNVYTLCADFGWSDLGTWKSLYENCSKNGSNNVINGRDNIITDNTYNSIIHLPEGKTAVINDLENFIIVDSGNSLLITKFENEQNIKENVNELKRRNEILISHP